jgi:hypothetical protein
MDAPNIRGETHQTYPYPPSVKYRPCCLRVSCKWSLNVFILPLEKIDFALLLHAITRLLKKRTYGFERFLVIIILCDILSFIFFSFCCLIIFLCMLYAPFCFNMSCFCKVWYILSPLSHNLFFSLFFFPSVFLLYSASCSFYFLVIIFNIFCSLFFMFLLVFFYYILFFSLFFS